jgi:hypothetical protein
MEAEAEAEAEGERICFGRAISQWAYKTDRQTMSGGRSVDGGAAA